jgi:hypothetical protein
MATCPSLIRTMKKARYWGNILEPIVAAHYTKRTGNRVRRINAVLQHPDPDLAWMLANIDREVTGASDVQILECKTAGINGARLWQDGRAGVCPVAGASPVGGDRQTGGRCGRAAWPVSIWRFIGSNGMTPDRRLIELERQFWHYVELDTPPPADGSESAERGLRCLYPEDHGQNTRFHQRPQSVGLLRRSVGGASGDCRAREAGSAAQANPAAGDGEASVPTSKPAA